MLMDSSFTDYSVSVLVGRRSEYLESKKKSMKISRRNARTSNNNDFIYDKELDNFLPRDENYIPDNI